MYCRNCGIQLSDQARFCHNCGAQQVVTPQPVTKKKSPWGFILGIAVCVLLVCGVISYLEDKDQYDVSSQPVSSGSSQPFQTKQSDRNRPENGWYTENGKTCYFSDGKALTGLQEINQVPYFFLPDGSLAVNEEVAYEGNMLETGSDGQVKGITVSQISGEWSSDKYHFGNNGTSSIMELSMDVENCDRTGFYIEANGLYGAKVNCNWKIYVRSHGTWVFAKEVYYTEPSGTFEIRFDYPMDFDAITAYPTIQGNASYEAFYALTDVHMGF